VTNEALLTRDADEGILRILSPIGLRSAGQRSLAERPAKLEGIRFGTVSNGKPGAPALLDGVAKGVAEAGVTKSIYVGSKRVASTPHPNLADVVHEADFVVYALGDCGSCTSWCIRDAVELELMGVPTAVIVSEWFEPLGHMEADSLGLPGLPLLVVPHPIANRPAEELVEIGRALADRAIAGLAADGSQVR
jgi:hypothetical protein